MGLNASTHPACADVEGYGCHAECAVPRLRASHVAPAGALVPVNRGNGLARVALILGNAWILADVGRVGETGNFRLRNAVF